MTTLTLIGKPDCHLCDVAEEIVELVVDELPAQVADGVVIERASILEDASLGDLWREKVPVVLIDGRLHAHWRLSADRLRAAILAADTEGAAPSERRETKRASE